MKDTLLYKGAPMLSGPSGLEKCSAHAVLVACRVRRRQVDSAGRRSRRERTVSAMVDVAGSEAASSRLA